MQDIQKCEEDEVDFLHADKHESFLQVNSITLSVRTQNNKFAIYFQYLKENVKDEVNFLLADKHQRFLQIDIIISGLCSHPYPNSPK